MLIVLAITKFSSILCIQNYLSKIKIAKREKNTLTIYASSSVVDPIKWTITEQVFFIVPFPALTSQLFFHSPLHQPKTNSMKILYYFKKITWALLSLARFVLAISSAFSAILLCIFVLSCRLPTMS